MGQEKGERADVVLVPVSKDDAADPVELVHEVGEIRDDVINPGQRIARETSARSQ